MGHSYLPGTGAHWEKQTSQAKHKRAGFNHQVICTLDGQLLAITAPLPGTRHDAYAFWAHGFDELLDASTLADKGHVGLGLAIPTKRKPGQRLSAKTRKNNRLLNCLRSVVERVIAQIKAWHTGFRRSLGSCGLVFYAGGGTFE